MGHDGFKAVLKETLEIALVAYRFPQGSAEDRQFGSLGGAREGAREVATTGSRRLLHGGCWADERL